MFLVFLLDMLDIPFDITTAAEEALFLFYSTRTSVLIHLKVKGHQFVNVETREWKSHRLYRMVSLIYLLTTKVTTEMTEREVLILSTWESVLMASFLSSVEKYQMLTIFWGSLTC